MHTGTQDMGTERGDAHEGTKVGRREAADGEMDPTGNRAGSSGRLEDKGRSTRF